MASSLVLLSVLLGAFLCCQAQLGVPGGWQKKTVAGNDEFQELAHFAISRQVQGKEFFDTVLEVTDAETQVIAGTNYRITFKTAESTCPVTQTYTKELCRPKTQTVKDTCTAVITVPLSEERFVSSYTCGAASK
ncbi:salivary cystatin-L2-like [Amblyomma americanum]